MAKMTNKPQRSKQKNNGCRSFSLNMRAVEGEGNERKRIISFSSEEPYDRWFGPEILSHAEGAIDLSRLNEIGVLLFNHKRDYVIGKIIEAWVEDNKGYAEVEFDSDEDAEKIFQKVKSETLRGSSVSYKVDSWESVAAGKHLPMEGLKDLAKLQSSGCHLKYPLYLFLPMPQLVWAENLKRSLRYAGKMFRYPYWKDNWKLTRESKEEKTYDSTGNAGTPAGNCEYCKSRRKRFDCRRTEGV